MNDKTWARIKKYTELQGTSGQEHIVRQQFRDELAPLVDEVKYEGLGGIFGVKQHLNSHAPRVMFAAHLDEVGFIVTDILASGALRVAAIGGWNATVISSQRFTLFTSQGEYPVVSSSVSPHLLRGGTKGPQLPTVDDILFDAGFVDGNEASAYGVRPGDFIVPKVETVLTANKKRVMSKAWDNRFGVVTILEALEALKAEQTPNTLIMGADVQEEVGLRGAHGAVNLLKPNIFFAIDSSAADDVSGAAQHQGVLDQGTLLRVFDPTVVMPVRLKEFLLSTAEDNHIPYQYFVSKGGTDAAAAQSELTGIPSVALGVASRYIHTHQTVWSIADFEAAKAFVVAIAKNLDTTNLKTIMGD
ncbi:glutamyl aminopeptidase [Leuconostoc carnosum]|uniref:glutamyl aminopeptidase n=1 Tax=Leuconostoc TaxID=1243 RepID=UPI000D509FC7|nr:MULTISPECIES: glutamyl aminopeptidase [Leuconostoc]KAA8325570.1 glutamyl aminopeptidase [Leuconostoc carnosum]KAA8359792.1 glutamyl aminopeptidase [Leuconostoc carnosum]KAA8365367.1 glutamyl aminopeptidase [Leuconostoc carnosum]KAA8367736.1 glutamyl aminopeptidase [Leuconostoc carnosum]KAA8372929.1 glutamyl aminopeptidase [Leuconostoc carnosum]